jgi:hypothetical protein
MDVPDAQPWVAPAVILPASNEKSISKSVAVAPESVSTIKEIVFLSDGKH